MSVDRRKRWTTSFYPILLSMLLSYSLGCGLAYPQTQSSNSLENKNILILNAFESNIPAFEKTNRGLSETLSSGGIGIRNQFYEHLDLVRNPDPESRALLLELMRQRYAHRKIDFIITLYPEALKFLLDECQTLFPHVPVLALYLPQGYKMPETGRQIILHLVIPDFKPTLETALKLVPDARHVYVAGGNHPLDKWLEKRVRRDFKPWEDRLTFHYLSNLPLKEILATAAGVSSDSILFITAFGQDLNGKYLTTVDVCRMLAGVSKVPVFGFLDTLLGEGIVGGSLISLEQIGIKAGQVLVEILAGERTVENVPRVLEVPQLDAFDWRQLKHWHLSASVLPAGSLIVNREFSLWDYRYYAIGVLAFIVLQSLLLLWLLAQKRHRKSAEEELKRRLEFERLLSEISAGFINLPAERIDEVILGTQRRVCEIQGLDFSALWQLSLEDPRYLYQTHVHRPAGGPPFPEKMEAESNYPWVLGQLKSGKIVAISTDAAPMEAARDQESWRHYGVKSSLTFPLSAGGDTLLFGALSFGTMREERVWPEPLVKQLELLAQVFANAIVRKRVDYELQENERRLKLATDAAGAGLWIMNEDTGDVWVSEKTRELFYFPPNEKISYEHFFKVIHPDDHEAVRQAVDRALQSGERLVSEYRIFYPDGSIRWIVAHGQRYGDTRPFRLMGVSFDITERMEAEAEFRKQWEHLAHVTRMGSMGELTASLAHEINQPLTAIQSNAEAAMRFMAANDPDTSEVCQILEDISRDNGRANSIILRIRAMLKKEPIPFEILDLNEQIVDVLSLLRADSLLRELVIIRDFSPELPPVLGDRVQLQQVVINLILNGAAAMKRVSADRRRLVIKTGIEKESAVKVSVADFGTGIDEENIEALFEPFYTTKSHGMGMGLAISQTIIREHGGTICASSYPEGGAVFAFTLPVHQGGPPW